MRRRIGEAAEVCEIQRSRAGRAQTVYARVPRLHVDVRWWRRRANERRALEAHSANVAGEHGVALRVVEGDVMRGVTRRMKRDQRAIATCQLRAIVEHRDALGGAGLEGAPERVHPVAIDARGARDQLGRIDHVTRAGWVHEQSRIRQHSEERARRAGMVEMDVRHDELGDVAQRDAGALHTALERGERGPRPGLEQCVPVRSGNEIRGDHAAATLKVEVEQPEAGVDLVRRNLHRGSRVGKSTQR